MAKNGKNSKNAKNGKKCIVTLLNVHSPQEQKIRVRIHAWV
jgi:hypothetical protein